MRAVEVYLTPCASKIPFEIAPSVGCDHPCLGAGLGRSILASVCWAASKVASGSCGAAWRSLSWSAGVPACRPGTLGVARAAPRAPPLASRTRSRWTCGGRGPLTSSRMPPRPRGRPPPPRRGRVTGPPGRPFRGTGAGATPVPHHRGEVARFVREEAIDPEPHQRTHLLRSINGPHQVPHPRPGRTGGH